MIYGLDILMNLRIKYIGMMVLLYMNCSCPSHQTSLLLLESIAFIKIRNEIYGLAQILLEFVGTMENHLNGLQKKI